MGGNRQTALRPHRLADLLQFQAGIDRFLEIHTQQVGGPLGRQAVQVELHARKQDHPVLDPGPVPLLLQGPEIFRQVLGGHHQSRQIHQAPDQVPLVDDMIGHGHRVKPPPPVKIHQLPQAHPAVGVDGVAMQVDHQQLLFSGDGSG